jgi:hypothetical protein
VGVRVRGSSLYGRACFAFGFLGIPLLQQYTSEIQPGCYQIRSEPNSGLEMSYRRTEFPLLRQDPTQCSLGLGM